MLSIWVRDGSSADIPAIEALIFEHGANQWNHLPEEDVRAHLAGLATGTTFAVLADKQRDIIGAVTYEVGEHYPKYQPTGRKHKEHGYIAEAVVHSDYVGKGIGVELLRTAIARLTKNGIREIYAIRHADNISSARMMEKAGMVVIDEFDNPEIRPSGSRRTAVTRFSS